MEEKKNNDGLIKLLCYLGIFVLLIFIILPPLFWNLFPEEENIVEEPKKSIMNLNCVKEEDLIDYKIKTTIDTNYVEEKISNSIFTYEIEYTNELFSGEEIIVEEYETLKRINDVDSSEQGNKRTIRIDYDSFDYSKEEALTLHKKMIVEQFTYYTTIEHFECKTTKIQ